MHLIQAVACSLFPSTDTVDSIPLEARWLFNDLTKGNNDELVQCTFISPFTDKVSFQCTLAICCFVLICLFSVQVQTLVSCALSQHAVVLRRYRNYIYRVVQKNCTFSIHPIGVTICDKIVFTKVFRKLIKSNIQVKLLYAVVEYFRKLAYSSYPNKCHFWVSSCVFSVIWHCWLVGGKSIWPVKTSVMRCWHGCLSGMKCIWLAYGPANATATALSLLQ